jgi:hypothetical protein
VHAERAALLVLRDGLDHRTENVRVDLLPVEIADMQEIGARQPAETRHIHAAREQAAVHIGKGIGPAHHLGPGAVCHLRIHRLEDFANHLMRVGRISLAHPFDRYRKKIIANKDVVLSAKKQKINRAMK